MNQRIVTHLNEIFDEAEQLNILKNLTVLKERKKVLELLQIEEMLELYSYLSRQKPFATLLIGEEDTVENQELVSNYQTHFENNFLKLHRQEMSNILSSSHLAHHMNKVKVMTETLKTVKNMHDNPEETLGKSTTHFQDVLEKNVVHHAEPNESKVKTYLKRAAYVVGALSLATMIVLTFPISIPAAVAGLAMTITHYVMFGLASVGLTTKVADTIYEKKKDTNEKKKAEAFKPYVDSAYHMNAFFRRKHESLSESVSKNDSTRPQLVYSRTA